MKGDRLAYFDAEVASIVNSSWGIRGGLGLASFKSVGQAVGLEFSDLVNTLLASLESLLIKCMGHMINTAWTFNQLHKAREWAL